MGLDPLLTSEIRDARERAARERREQQMLGAYLLAQVDRLAIR
jgi:hypothetical protein